jgi:spermidine/putrescine transport system ATP-binding protein
MQLELKRLQTETGITFIFVTHDQEEALTMSDRIAVMQNGAIHQIGGPRDIYDHPADRFVADFIGDTNFLPAEVISQDGDTVRLRLASGSETTTGADHPVTGKVTLALRPEHARLSTIGDGLLTGTVTDVVYFGTDTHVHLALEDGTAFVLRQQNTPEASLGATTGDRVGVRFADHVAQVLKD